MELDEILERLQEAGGFSDVYELRTFKGYRRAKNGDLQEVLIEILDEGAFPPHSRYTERAQVEPSRDMPTRLPQAAGDGGPTLDVAIASVHWGDLDGDPGQP